MKNPLANVTIVALRTGAITGTLMAGPTDLDVLATDLIDARIEAIKSGIFIIEIEVLDLTTMNETYEVALIGRQDVTGLYTDLGVIVPVAVGLHAVAVPGPIPNGLNYRIAFGGTSPELTFSAMFIGTEVQYLPDTEVVVTA